jgi:hypothetical protein
MTGEWPPHEIDHIDLDGDNNRWANLREATHRENARNAKMRSHNKAGFKGVCLDKRRNLWRATIHDGKKQVWLGYFPTAEDAHVAYREASERLHGEYGRLQ